MQRITSFSVDHDYIVPGMYVSRIDGDITTYDLRTRKPNGGDYMDNVTMHSMEHMLATFLRNSDAAEDVIYFGPMGCRTGFYLILRDSMSKADALQLVRDAFRFAADFEGEIPGAKKIECGNYLEHDLTGAKQEAAAYCGVLSRCSEATMVYPD